MWPPPDVPGPSRPPRTHPFALASMPQPRDRGRSGLPQERATAHTPQAVVTMPRPKGLVVGPAHHFFGCRAPGVEGVRRGGSGKPGVKGRSAHPEALATTPQNAATIPAKKREWGWRRRGLRKDPAGLNSRPRRNTAPQAQQTTQVPHLATPPPQKHLHPATDTDTGTGTRHTRRPHPVTEPETAPRARPGQPGTQILSESCPLLARM